MKTGAPLKWKAWIYFAGSDERIAYIQNGQVITYPGGVLVAEVLIGETPWWGSTARRADWLLRIHDGSDPRLRLMGFAWFQIAWEMQRYLDDSD